jgi:hypothetical protein
MFSSSVVSIFARGKTAIPHMHCSFLTFVAKSLGSNVPSFYSNDMIKSWFSAEFAD